MVERYLPHLFNDYGRICALSEEARYGEGCAMGDRERQKAREIHKRISTAIPWP